MNYTLYLDNLQRLIMAEKIAESSLILKVKNPLILHVTTTNGQLNIQFYPIMFREFQADKDEGSTWNVPKNNITQCDPITLEARLIAQYKRIFEPLKNMPPVNMGGTPQPQQPPAAVQGNPTNVIKLFDD